MKARQRRPLECRIGEDERQDLQAAIVGCIEQWRQLVMVDEFRGDEVRAHQQHGDRRALDGPADLVAPVAAGLDPGVVPDLQSRPLERQEMHLEPLEPSGVEMAVTDEYPLPRFRGAALRPFSPPYPSLGLAPPRHCDADPVPAQLMLDQALRHQALDDALRHVGGKPEFLADLERGHDIRRVPKAMTIDGNKECMLTHQEISHSCRAEPAEAGRLRRTSGTSLDTAAATRAPVPSGP